MEFTRPIGKASTSIPGSWKRLWILPLPWTHGRAFERFRQGYSGGEIGPHGRIAEALTPTLSRPTGEGEWGGVCPGRRGMANSQ